MKSPEDRNFLMHGYIVRKIFNNVGAYPHKFELCYGYLFDENKDLAFLYKVRVLEEDIHYIKNISEKIEKNGHQVISCDRNIMSLYADLWIVNYEINSLLKIILKIQHRFCNFSGLVHDASVYDATKHRIEFISDFF